MVSTGLTSNPFSDITVTVPTPRGSSVSQSFTCNFNSASNKHISKVFGTDVFDKDKNEYPVYVHEVYPNLVNNLFEQGLIRGLSTDESVLTEGGHRLLANWLETCGDKDAISVSLSLPSVN